MRVCPFLKRICDCGIKLFGQSQMGLALDSRFCLQAAECDQQRCAIVRAKATACNHSIFCLSTPHLGAINAPFGPVGAGLASEVPSVRSAAARA